MRGNTQTLSSADVDQMLRVAVAAVERLTEYVMTEREGRQIPEPTDALLLAIDRLQLAVARLAQHAPDTDRAAFDAALGQLLVVVFDRVSSMAATPTVLLSPRLERLEQSHARTVETVV